MTDAQAPTATLTAPTAAFGEADREMAFTLDASSAYEILAPAVLGYLRAMGASEPEDLLGEVFVQVVRDSHRFRGDEAGARSWVFAIAHHRLIDDRRRRAHRPVIVRSQLPDPVDDADPATVAMVADPALVEALAQLTHDQRAVVALRFVADLPTRDVARILHRRSGAIKALQNRALNRLAALLDG